MKKQMKIKFFPLQILIFSLLLLMQYASAFSLPDDILLDRGHGGDGSAWGMSRCDSCHLLNFIHDKTQAKLRKLVRDKGYASCSGCHGDNGTHLLNPHRCVCHYLDYVHVCR